jgi:hypothetical protein
MFKEYIVLILLRFLLIRETEAKEHIMEMEEIEDRIANFDDAIENCTQRPTRKAKLFTVIPPVSQ